MAIMVRKELQFVLSGVSPSSSFFQTWDEPRPSFTPLIAWIQPAAMSLAIADGQRRENRQQIRDIGEIWKSEK